MLLISMNFLRGKCHLFIAIAHPLADFLSIYSQVCKGTKHSLVSRNLGLFT